jgi:uncharacterized sulfatase
MNKIRRRRRRTNVLFLLADQMRYDCLGTLNPAIRTPHLDRLAGEGLTLTRAYAPTPVCLPCRASLATGQYPASHGAMHNHTTLRRDHPSLVAESFNRGGYYTHMIGKSHLSSCHDPCSLEAPPHIHNLDYFRRWHGPWYGFRRADLCIGHTTERHACGMHYGAWLRDQGVDLDRYFGHTAYEAYGAWDLPGQFHNSKWVADTAIAAIRHGAEHEQPFYLWVNFQDPHNPCMVPEPWAGLYADADIPVPGYKPGEPECFAHKPPFYREIIEQPGPYAGRPADPDMKDMGNVSHLDWTPEQTRANAACYYGMVSLMDHHIGRILDALDACGAAEDTLVVFSSDHGELLGDHGFWYKSLVAYEESMRVPLLARLPGRIPAGAVSPALHSLVDLPATFLDYAGLPRPYAFEGVNQRRAWESPGTALRDAVVVEERPADTAWNQRLLVTDTHKLVFYAHRPYGELYDMQADPHQVRNLWDAPSAAALKHELIARLLSMEMNRVAPTPRPGLLMDPV